MLTPAVAVRIAENMPEAVCCKEHDVDDQDELPFCGHERAAVLENSPDRGLALWRWHSDDTGAADWDGVVLSTGISVEQASRRAGSLPSSAHLPSAELN